MEGLKIFNKQGEVNEETLRSLSLEGLCGCDIKLNGKPLQIIATCDSSGRISGSKGFNYEGRTYQVSFTRGSLMAGSYINLIEETLSLETIRV